MSAVFFASYARADEDRKNRLARTINDLREEVARHVGISNAQAIGFLDVADINSGEEWERRIGEALRTSRVLVCLCSPSYLNSHYCAKEFHIFRRRLEEAPPDVRKSVAIIPLWWRKTATVELPKALARYQLHEGNPPETLGLYNLVRMRRRRYENYLSQLASRIGDALSASKLGDWEHPIRFDDLPHYFDDPSTSAGGIRVVVLHPLRTQWKVGYAGFTNVGSIIDKAIHDATWQEIAPDLHTIRGSLADVIRLLQFLIVIADAALLQRPPWQNLLEIIETTPDLAFTMVLAASPATAGSWAESAPKIEGLIECLVVDPNSVDFGKAIERAAAHRDRLLAAAPVRRAESAELQEEAARRALAIETLPMIGGGGGKPS